MRNFFNNHPLIALLMVGLVCDSCVAISYNIRRAFSDGSSSDSVIVIKNDANEPENKKDEKVESVGE